MKHPYTLIAAVTLGTDRQIHLQCWAVQYRDSDTPDYQIWWCHDYHEDSHLEATWYTRLDALTHLADLTIRTLMGLDESLTIPPAHQIPEATMAELERWGRAYSDRYRYGGGRLWRAPDPPPH